MISTINNSLVAQLKPTNKQYEVRDSKLKGFLIRVNPSGKMNYVCEYRRGKRVTLGQVGILSPIQARDKAKEVIGDAIKGIEPNGPKKQVKITTLKEFIDDKYQPWIETHRKAGVDAVLRIKRCFYPLFANHPLDKLSALLIDQWRTNKLKTGRTTQTINRDVATFKAALSKAVEWDLIESHPLEKLKLFRVDTSSKIRYLTKDEEIQLRKALYIRDENIKKARINANEWRSQRNYILLPILSHQSFADHLKPMVLISINTGVRQGELFNLSWDNIDFSKNIMTITGDNAKNGKTRHIPLNQEARNTLLEWHQQTTGTKFVFPNKEGKKFDNIHKSWRNVLKLAQIENFRWHDIRHHFASRLVMAGVDLNTVRELLGHSDIKMTLRYAHLAPEHKANAVAKLCSGLLDYELVAESYHPKS